MTGIDVNAIVSSIMDVEKLGLKRLDNKKAIYDYQNANYKQLSSLLGKFSTAMDNIGPVIRNNAWKISSSNDAIVSSVLSGSNASPGAHTIDISQLAQANQIASAAFADKSTALGLTKNLDIQIASNTLSLAINSDDTLETIRDKINISLNNPGVTASILATTSATDTPEYRLVLTSNQTGVANQMVLSGDAVSPFGLTDVLKAAADAQFTFDGFNATRSTNTISDLLDGITFTLNAPSGSATLNITADNQNKTTSVMSAIQSMLDAYNAIIDFIDKNQSTKSTRDSTYETIKMQLQNTMQQTLGSGPVTRLLDLGIVTLVSKESQTRSNDDGKEYYSIGQLTIKDSGATAAFIDANFSALTTFFTTNSTGFISSMDQTIKFITGVDGNIPQREKIIQSQELYLDQQIFREETRLDALQETLTKKYASLDLYVQRYENLSNFLENQLKSLSNIYKK